MNNRLSEMLDGDEDFSSVTSTGTALERLKTLNHKSAAAPSGEAEKATSKQVALVAAEELGWTSSAGAAPKKNGRKRKAAAEPRTVLYVRLPAGAGLNFARWCEHRGLTNVEGVLELMGNLPEGYRPGD